MNIMMIHHRLPYPLHSGMDKVRYNLICSLMTQHQVTLIVPVIGDNSADDICQVEKICTKLIVVPISESRVKFRKSRMFMYWRWWRLVVLRRPMYTTTDYFSEVSQAIKKTFRDNTFDVVQVMSNVAGRYIEVIPEGAKVILGPMDDSIEAARTNGRVATGFKARAVWKLRQRARKYYDARICRIADWTFFHSPDDLHSFSDATGGGFSASVLPTAVETGEPDGFDLEHSILCEKPGSIVFVGGLGSAFNIDAVLYFHREIYTLVKSRFSGTHFHIVGQNPPRDIVALGQEDDVSVTGSVASVRPYIENAAVYIAPVRSGTGFKTKIVEALSLGKAIVSLPGGVQGLWDLGEGAMRVVSDAQSFADETVNILEDYELRRRLKKSARKLYEDVYSFDAVTPLVLEEYDRVAGHEIIMRRSKEMGQ